MCSRLALLFALLLLPGAANAAGRLEVGGSVAQLDFDDAIRFDNDQAWTLRAGADLFPAWQMSMSYGFAHAFDRRRADWAGLHMLGVESRFEPWPARRVGPVGLLGVNFTAFPDRPPADSIGEGLDLGLGLRWSPLPQLRLRADFLLRMQSFTRFEPDGDGLPQGEPIESGYLWSRVFRVGVGRVF